MFNIQKVVHATKLQLKGWSELTIQWVLTNMIGQKLWE